MRLLPALLLLSLLPLLSCKPEGDVDVRIWRRFEATLPIPVAAANPFDPEQADVVVEFQAPGGDVATTPAFIYRSYTHYPFRLSPRTSRCGSNAPHER